MDAAHKRAMEAGRKRYQLQRQKEAVKRVKAYEHWLTNGSRGPIPEIPSDADYQAARRAGAVRR